MTKRPQLGSSSYNTSIFLTHQCQPQVPHFSKRFSPSLFFSIFLSQLLKARGFLRGWPRRKKRRNSPDTKTSPVDCSHHWKQLKVWWHFLKHKQTRTHERRIPSQQPTQRRLVVRLSKQQRSTSAKIWSIASTHDERSRLTVTLPQHQTRGSLTIEHLRKIIPDVAKQADLHMTSYCCCLSTCTHTKRADWKEGKYNFIFQ